MTRPLFDHLARSYDAQFSDRVPAQRLRQAVYAHVEPLVHAGSVVLEVGCGTGVDAVWFAARGCRVRATDVSPEMLRLCRARVRRAGLESRISVGALDLESPDDGADEAPASVDLIFSNFGALNCIADLQPFLSMAQRKLKPGGFLAVTLMGRFCLWEAVHFALKGRMRSAARRWRGYAPYAMAGVDHGVWFHSPKRLVAAARGFSKHELIGVGSVLPHSEAFSLWERMPRLFSVLAGLDTLIETYSHAISDHYLLVLRRDVPACRWPT